MPRPRRSANPPGLKLAVPLLLAALAGCAEGPPEYVQVQPIPDLIEAGFDAPKRWTRLVLPEPGHKGAWSVRLQPSEDSLVSVRIEKYSLSGNPEGIPVLTPEELWGRIRGLPGVRVEPERRSQEGRMPFIRLPYERYRVEAPDGSGSANQRGEAAYCTANGFLYAVLYDAPADEFDRHFPVFARVLATFRIG